MKFQTHCCLFNFLHIRFSWTAHRNTMKNATKLLRWPCLLQDVLNRRLLFKNKPAAVAIKGNHHPSFLRFWTRRKLLMQPKFVAAQKMLLKQKPATLKWIARFYYFRHLYSAGSVCIAHIIAWAAHRYGQLYLHCSLIYFWVPSSCFCIVISLSLWEGEIIPFSGGSPVGEAALSTPEAALTHRLTDCFDVQPTTTSGNIITQSIIFSFSIS